MASPTAQGVPDQWGQPATGGTKFLGTPDNYAELLKTRPISPDLFGVEGASRRRCRAAQRRSGLRGSRTAARAFASRLSCGALTGGARRCAGGSHYKFPPVALSSITTRVTGVVLSGGACGRGRSAPPQP